MPVARSGEADGRSCRMRITKPSLRKARLAIHSSPPFEAQGVVTSAFATLDDIRRTQMTLIHLDMPRHRHGAHLHRRQRGAARDVAGRMLTTWREWRRRAHGRAELAKLDDAMLKD